LDLRFLYESKLIGKVPAKKTAEVLSIQSLPFGLVTRTKTGWTLGAGIEGALAGSWTWKLEYLYVDLGSIAGTFPGRTFPGAGETLTAQSRFTDNMLRAGLNFRFK